MTDQTVICNYKNCKAPITDFACVTKCSHIFCKNHIIAGETTYRRCHTCSAVLEGEFDVVYHRNINATEELKSVRLTGYPVDVIFDIMARGIRFWEYQTNLKIQYYKLGAEHLKNRLADKQRIQEKMTLNMKHYIKKQEEKVGYLKREVENLSASVKDLEKQLREKNRQLLSMKSRFEELRWSSMASMITQAAEEMETEPLEFVGSQRSTANYTEHREPPPTPVFVFHPQHTPKSGSSGSILDLLSRSK